MTDFSPVVYAALKALDVAKIPDDVRVENLMNMWIAGQFPPNRVAAILCGEINRLREEQRKRRAATIEAAELVRQKFLRMLNIAPEDGSTVKRLFSQADRGRFADIRYRFMASTLLSYLEATEKL